FRGALSKRWSSYRASSQFGGFGRLRKMIVGQSAGKVADERILQAKWGLGDGRSAEELQLIARFSRHIHKSQSELIASHRALDQASDGRHRWRARGKCQHKLLDAASECIERAFGAQYAIVQNCNVIGHALDVRQKM